MAKVFAILGDIHSNIDALRVVIDDARSQGVTDFLCVGDVVGYNAAPAECIHLVRDELACRHVVRGNHDHYVSYPDEVKLEEFHPAAASVVEWTRRQLTPGDAQWLHDLPLSRPVMGFTLVHSTLDMPDRWGYVFDDLQANANFVYQRTPICFHGHTHVPIIYEKTALGMEHYDPQDFAVQLGQKLFINVGSVGQPRDGDPRASYVIYSMADKSIRFRRLEYDVAAAQERIRSAGLPERCAARLEVGR